MSAGEQTKVLHNSARSPFKVLSDVTRKLSNMLHGVETTPNSPEFINHQAAVQATARAAAQTSPPKLNYKPTPMILEDMAVGIKGQRLARTPYIPSTGRIIQKVIQEIPHLSKPITTRALMWRAWKNLPMISKVGVGATMAAGALGLFRSFFSNMHEVLTSASIEKPTPNIQEVYHQIDILAGKEDSWGNTYRGYGSDFGSPVNLAKATLRAARTMRHVSTGLIWRSKIIDMPLRLARVEGTHVQLHSWLPGMTSQRKKSFVAKLAAMGGHVSNERDFIKRSVIHGRHYGVIHGRTLSLNRLWRSKRATGTDVVNPVNLAVNNTKPEYKQYLIMENSRQHNISRKLLWKQRGPKPPELHEFKRNTDITYGRASALKSRLNVKNLTKKNKTINLELLKIDKSLATTEWKSDIVRNLGRTAKPNEGYFPEIVRKTRDLDPVVNRNASQHHIRNARKNLVLETRKRITGQSNLGTRGYEKYGNAKIADRNTLFNNMLSVAV